MRSTLVTTLAALVAAPLMAQDNFIVGPRALGMGGAGVAATDDHNASYYNPGMYGFFSRTGTDDAGEETRLEADPNYVGRKDWGIGLVDFGLNYEIRGRLADYVEQVQDIDLGRLSDLSGADATDEDLKAAMAFVGLIGNFRPTEDFITANVNLGVLNTRIMHFGIGVRSFAQTFVSVADLDLTNIGFGTDLAGTTVVDEINATSVTPDGWTAGHTPTLITGSIATNVQNALLVADPTATAGELAEAISKLDYAASQAGLTATDMEVIAGSSGAVLVEALENSVTGGADVNNNTTAIFAGGFAWSEVPVTYGYAINDNLSIGGSLKLMVGRVAAAKVRAVSETDTIDKYMQDAMEEAVQSVTGGVDLGVAFRAPYIQAGLTARNLNRPVFKGGTFKDIDNQEFTVDDVEMSPQVSVGLALYPFETFVITADADLLESTSTLRTTSQRTDLPAGAPRTLEVEYKTRRVGGGAEWNILRFLALRGGAYKNLADEESSLTYTGGIGLNLYLLRLDVAGAISSDTVTVDGEDVPKSGAVSLGLAIDF